MRMQDKEINAPDSETRRKRIPPEAVHFNIGMGNKYSYNENITIGELYDRYSKAILDLRYLDPKTRKDHLPEYNNARTKKSTLNLLYNTYHTLFDTKVNDLIKEDLAAYNQSYMQQNAIKKSSMEKKRTTLRGMFTWARRNNYILENPTRSLEPIQYANNQKQVDESNRELKSTSLKTEDLQKLFEGLEERENRRRREREFTNRHRAPDKKLPEFPKKGEGYTDHYYVFINLALRTGARVGSLVGLKWKDIEFSTSGDTNNLGKIVFRGSIAKAGNDIETSLDSTMEEILTIWRDQHKITNSTEDMERYVFESPVFPGYPIRSDSYKSTWKRLQKDSGLSKYYRMHDLRHTFATMGLKAGVDLETVSKILGHTKVSTTLLYLHTDMQTKEQAITNISKSYDYIIQKTDDKHQSGAGENVSHQTSLYLNEKTGRFSGNDAYVSDNMDLSGININI